MATIAYEEIGYSEKTGKDTVKHLWHWNKELGLLSHFVDDSFVDEYKGDVAKKKLAELMG